MPALVPPVADERAGLLGYLAHQRHQLTVTAYGLTEEQARSAPTRSALSIGGLIKHLAAVERGWTDTIRCQQRDMNAGGYEDGFRLTEGETLAGVLADYRLACQETDEAVAAIADLGQPVPVPDAPWFPADLKEWSVRWVLLHLIEETARHLGHADLVRETIDGATAYELLAGAEDWPETDWIKPWKAPAAE